MGSFCCCYVAGPTGSGRGAAHYWRGAHVSRDSRHSVHATAPGGAEPPEVAVSKSGAGQTAILRITNRSLVQVLKLGLFLTEPHVDREVL